MVGRLSRFLLGPGLFSGAKCEALVPRKLTWQWNIHHLKMYFLVNMGIFQCHVSFQGCSFKVPFHGRMSPLWFLQIEFLNFWALRFAMQTVSQVFAISIWIPTEFLGAKFKGSSLCNHLDILDVQNWIPSNPEVSKSKGIDIEINDFAHILLEDTNFGPFATRIFGWSEKEGMRDWSYSWLWWGLIPSFLAKGQP